MVRRISNLFLNTSSEKVSFCALNKKASLALETALVLPMFLLGMVTMISFMDIYRIQTEHLQALCEKTKEAGINYIAGCLCIYSDRSICSFAEGMDA